MRKVMVVLGVMVMMVTAGLATDPPTKSHQMSMSGVTASWVTPTKLRITWNTDFRVSSNDPGVTQINPNGAGLHLSYTLSVNTPGGQVIQLMTLPVHLDQFYCSGGCPGLSAGCGSSCYFRSDGIQDPNSVAHCEQNEFDGGAAQPCGFGCWGSTDEAAAPWPPLYGMTHCLYESDTKYYYECTLCKGLGTKSQELELGVAGAAIVRGGNVQVHLNALNFTDATSGDDVSSGPIPQ
jgi:hypothetical protein